MDREPVPDWPEPRRTGNAHLLAGFISGTLALDGTYQPVTYSPQGIEIENKKTGNRFMVRVEQIAGEE